MLTATDTVTISNRMLTPGELIQADEVTLTGATGSAHVRARAARIRNCSLDVLNVMAQQVVIDNSNIDTVELRNPDRSWGRLDAVDIMIRLSHVYVVKLEHAGTMTVDRSWVSRIEAETMQRFDAGATHIDELWVRWGDARASIDDCAIGRTNLMVVDCGVDHSGYRMNVIGDVESDQITVSYRGRRMTRRIAAQVFEDNPELTAMLHNGVAKVLRKKEVYS